jgi:ABC-type bacteriocin/lantibiotic exporter with double-glycine peptidase domain
MNTCFRSWAICSLWLAPVVVRAEVPIPMECRVRDLPGDRCGWCALETLARFHHITELNHLADKQTGRASIADLEAALDKVEVNFRVQDPGIRNKAILRYAVREKLGAIVGFRELTPGAGRHIVTLVDYEPDEVRVIDSNDSDGRIRTMSLKRFLSWWDGFVLVIEPDEERTDSTKGTEAEMPMERNNSSPPQPEKK